MLHYKYNSVVYNIWIHEENSAMVRGSVNCNHIVGFIFLYDVIKYSFKKDFLLKMNIEFCRETTKILMQSC